MQLRRRGVETRMVIPGEAVTQRASRTRPRPVSVTGLRLRLSTVLRELASGELLQRNRSRTERVSATAMYAMWSLSGLQPAIVESICAGRQSVVTLPSTPKGSRYFSRSNGMRNSGSFRTRTYSTSELGNRCSTASFLVAPNSFATETNRAESAFCTAVASLRFHGCALFAPHAPISSLLHDVGKHARLCGGEGGIRTLGTGYPVRQISNLVPSTTRPPLRVEERERAIVQYRSLACKPDGETISRRSSASGRG